jgi:hypothetical protein
MPWREGEAGAPGDRRVVAGLEESREQSPCDDLGGGLAGPLARGVHHRQGQLGAGDQDLPPVKPGVVAGHDVPRTQVALAARVQDDLQPQLATRPGPFDRRGPRQCHAAAAGGVGGALGDRDPGDLYHRLVQRGANIRRPHGLQHAVDQHEGPVLDGVANEDGCALGILDQLVDSGEQPVGLPTPGDGQEPSPESG